MGFLSSILGGDSIDASGSYKQIQNTEDAYRSLYEQNAGLNQPYIAGGTGAFNMLTDLLGVQQAPQSALPLGATPYSPNYDARSGIPRRDYYLTGDKVWYKDGDQVYSTARDGQDGWWNEFESVAAPQAPAPSENFGSLLEPFDLEKFDESPNYQFVQEQGEQALARAAAARGDYFSPEALKELNDFNSGLASGESTNSYNMYNNDQNNVFNRLMGVANVGYDATGRQMNDNNLYGSNYANVSNSRAGLDIANQEAKASNRQSAFGNLMNVASIAGAPFSGGASLFGMATGGQGLFSGGIGNAFNAARGYYGPGF